MPKVIQINTVSNFGSTGKIMEAIGLLAKSEGWDTKIAVGGRYSLQSQLETYTISTVNQSRISAMHSLLTDRHGFANRSETKAFLSWLKEETPDIVHLHNFHSYIINIELLFNYLAASKTPVVWTLHDCWPFTGHCSHFIDIDCYKWKGGCFDCPKTHSFPKSLFFDRSRQNYRDKKRLFTSVNNLSLVTVSHWLGNMVEQSFLGKYPVNVIPNGVDLKKFKPSVSHVKSKYNLDDKKVLLGVSTDWCKAKGLYDYVKLRKELPDDYAIVLIGMKPEQIKEIQPSGIVCIEKTQNVDELVAWYNAADIILNISYAETFGLPVAEGYACGKPAVVYDNTALSELIVPDVGMKVSTGNISELVKAIEIVVCKEVNEFVEPCRKRAETLYDREKNYKQYIELYNNAIAKQIS